METEQKIFKSGSTTYYFSSRFFPKKTRREVMRLYSFVRTADNYVDKQPIRPSQLRELGAKYHEAIKDPGFDSVAHQWDELNSRVVKNMVHLRNKYHFEDEWVDAFLASMKMDIDKKSYANLDDVLRYVHGSAEVVGLMMARIMRLDKTRELPDAPTKKQLKTSKLDFVRQASSYAAKKIQPDPRLKSIDDSDIAAIEKAAQMQGRAMQWLNFIRDIAEDNKLGRCYFPKSDLKKYKLKDLSERTAKDHPEAFRKFIDAQLVRYREWQADASKGFRYIPRRTRVALQTAVDMYNWTAKKIEKDPFVVYRHKIKPRKSRVMRSALKNSAKLKKTSK